MKGDWFCPSVLLVAGGVWLAVSAYFATSHWNNLTLQRGAWERATCTLSSQDATPCSYLDKDAVEVRRCRATLTFAPTVQLSAGGERRTAQGPVPVYRAGPAQGCVFANCQTARKWLDDVAGARSNLSCWAHRTNEQPILKITDPAGSSRRDSIVFTACACVAGVLVLVALFVMGGLVVKSCKGDVP